MYACWRIPLVFRSRDSAYGYDWPARTRECVSVRLCVSISRVYTPTPTAHQPLAYIYGVIDIAEILIGLKSIVTGRIVDSATPRNPRPYSVCRTIWSLTHICMAPCFGCRNLWCGAPLPQLRAYRQTLIGVRRRRRRRRIIYRKDICQY